MQPSFFLFAGRCISNPAMNANLFGMTSGKHNYEPSLYLRFASMVYHGLSTGDHVSCDLVFPLHNTVVERAGIGCPGAGGRQPSRSMGPDLPF